MTDKQKASKILNYLEDLGDATIIINYLSPFVTDKQLADIYDRELGFLIEEEEEYYKIEF